MIGTKPQKPKLLELAASFAVLALLILYLGPEKIIGSIYGADPLFLLLGLAVYFATMLLMSLRIAFILRGLGEKLGFSHSFWANSAGLLASDFTPARAGYFIVPFLLSRRGIPFEKGMVTILSPQVVDFMLKSIGAMAAVFVLASGIAALSSNLPLLALGICLMAVFSLLMGAAIFIPQSAAIVGRFNFVPFASKIADFLSTMHAHRGKVASIFPAISIFSIAAFLLKGAEWYFFGIALGVEFSSPLHPFIIFLLLQPLITAFQFAPLPTMAGIGASEGSAVVSMALLGVSAELAIAYIFTVRAATTLADCLGARELLLFWGSPNPQK